MGGLRGPSQSCWKTLGLHVGTATHSGSFSGQLGPVAGKATGCGARMLSHGLPTNALAAEALPAAGGPGGVPNWHRCSPNRYAAPLHGVQQVQVCLSRRSAHPLAPTATPGNTLGQQDPDPVSTGRTHVHGVHAAHKNPPYPCSSNTLNETLVLHSAFY